MRTPYQPLNERDYLRSQLQYGHNNILTLGNGIGDIQIFRDRRLRRGSGAFTNLILRYGKQMLPYLQKYLWPAAKEFGKNVAGDVISGDTSIKQSLKNRTKQSVKNVGKRILRGDGRKRSKKRKKRKNVKRIGRGRNTKKRKLPVKRRRHVGGAKKKVVRRKRKTKRVKKTTLTMRSVDCSRPSMKNMCKKDIFS